MQTREIRQLGWIGLLLTCLGVATFPSPAVASAEALCPGQLLARRNGSETCWVQYSLSETRALCIPRQLWERYLTDGTHSLCGTWKGKWKAFSPAQNSPQEEEKKTWMRFMATELPPLEHPEQGRSIFARAIERLRERSSAKLRSKDDFGVLRRLLLDERMPGSGEGLLRSVGFVHLLTASGIHLYSLASFAQELALLIGKSAGLKSVTVVRCARIFAGTLWMVAWVLGGMRPGMVRPWLVIMVRQVSRAAGFRWRFWAPLAIALGADLIMACFRLLDGDSAPWAPGRWHYALAVGGGLLAIQLHERQRMPQTGTARLRKVVEEHALLAIGSWLLTALWDAWMLGTLAAATPVLNVLTLPMFSLGIYPASFAGILLDALGEEGLALRISQWAGWAVSCITRLGAEAAMASSSVWVLPRWSICAGAACAGMILLRGRKLRLSQTLVALLALICMRALTGGVELLHRRASLPAPGPVAEKVEQLDIGQGDAALVHLGPGGPAGMVDTGSQWALKEDAWLRLFAERGMTDLDWIALTHLDEDHAGGVTRLIRLMSVSCVVTSKEELATARGIEFMEELSSLNVKVADWSSGCVSYPVLPLIHREKGARAASGNANMSALWIPLRSGASWVNLGDADHKQEAHALSWLLRMKSRYPGPVYFKVSHHGSRYSSSARLIQVLRPAEAWISAGTGNRHGHPTHRVLDLFQSMRTKLWRTDRDGVLSTDGGGT